MMTAALNMPWPLPWPFDREYMQLALIAGLVIGIAAPLIGAFLVQRQLALIGDGIGHVALAGVGVGLWLGVAPLWSALVAAIAAALTIEWLRARGKTSSDVALSVLFYGGIAAGVVFASKAGSSANLLPFLFGSILTIRPVDALIILGLGVLIVAVLLFSARALLAALIDPEGSRVAGLPVNGLNALLAVLTAVTVVASMRIVGVLLIAALIVLPIAVSSNLAHSFRHTMLFGSAIGAMAVIVGLAVARAFDLAPGGTIVLVVTGVFLVTAIATSRRRGAGSHEHDHHHDHHGAH
jgi:zinc transport system permease protein